MMASSPIAAPAKSTAAAPIVTSAPSTSGGSGSLERSVFSGPEVDPLSDGWIGTDTMRALRDPESQAIRPLLEQEIRDALDALPEDYRMAVLLVDVEELSYKEAADVMGCPTGTVMSRLHRGRRHLKTRLLEQARALGIAPDRETASRNSSGGRFFLRGLTIFRCTVSACD